MADNSTKFKLKRPTLIWILAVGFLISPLTNLIGSLIAAGHPNWYSPLVWWALATRLPISEISLLLAIFSAGLLLLYQRKSSWLVAVVILIMASVYSAFGEPPDSGFQNLSWIHRIVNISVLVVFYFFRFPYLDKRDSVFRGMSTRYALDLPVKLNNGISGKLKNISKSGCFVSLGNADLVQFSPGQNLSVEIADVLFECTVAYKKDGLGLQFAKLENGQRNQIKKLISKQS